MIVKTESIVQSRMRKDAESVKKSSRIYGGCFVPGRMMSCDFQAKGWKYRKGDCYFLVFSLFRWKHKGTYYLSRRTTQFKCLTCIFAYCFAWWHFQTKTINIVWQVGKVKVTVFRFSNYLQLNAFIDIAQISHHTSISFLFYLVNSNYIINIFSFCSVKYHCC